MAGKKSTIDFTVRYYSREPIPLLNAGVCGFEGCVFRPEGIAPGFASSLK